MKFIAKTLIYILAAAATLGVAQAQGPARGRIEPARDEQMEITAKHNLDVARYYLTRRKAYDGARDRLQEIIDTYADFSRMDEVLFLMGEAQIKLHKPDKASEYYSKMLKDYPNSEFAKRARERLDELKATEKAKG